MMRRTSVSRLLWILTPAAALAVSGCGEGSDPAGPQATNLAGEGQLIVGLSVASDPETPFPGDGFPDGETVELAALYLTINGITAYHMPETPDSSCMPGDGPQEPDGDPPGPRHGDPAGPHGDDPPGPHGPHGLCEPVELPIDPITVDVTALDSTLTVLLGAGDLPAGAYSHLELGLSDAWIVTLEDEEIPVSLPARGDSSLKVMTRFSVEEDGVTGIAIVIDLERSVREIPPGSGQYILRPVLWGERGNGEEDQWRHQHGRHGDGPGGGEGPGDGHGNGECPGGDHDGHGPGESGGDNPDPGGPGGGNDPGGHGPGRGRHGGR
ncbi:MAG: DUF4382 domain-containing protein [Candidatus Eisenbacteria bacterium]|nr:DUF4382 domain-containing protein [Candidatus Eisenbacteria bacterium]